MQTQTSTEISTTRTAIARSVEATKSALNRLPPVRADLVRVQVALELEAFIQNEWLPAARVRSARDDARIRFHEIMRAA